VKEGMTKRFGAEHPETLNSMANISLSYKQLWKFEAATKLAKEVLAMGTGNDVTTLTLRANLAVALFEKKIFDKAEALGEQVLDERRKILGGNHPDTLIFLSILAMVYNSQGKWEKAGNLMVETIEKQRSRLGEHHPSTLISKFNLSLIRLEQGQWEMAEDVWVNILAKVEAVLGREHECTVRCR